MPFTNTYPYTDFHEMNLDWFLQEFQKITNYVENEMDAQIQDYINEHLQDIIMNGDYNVKDVISRSQLLSHIGNTLNPHRVTKVQVGLGNVDNTSDMNKPVSNAQQAALAEKAFQSDLITERNRISSLAVLNNGSTTGDAELIDGRTTANGKTFTTIGGAIRGIGSGLGIANNSIVPSKLTYTKTINIKDLPISNANSYIDSSGNIAASQILDVYKFECSGHIQKIETTMGTNLLPNAYYTNGNYSTVVSGTTVRRIGNGTIYFNKEKENNTSGYLSMTITYNKEGFLDVNDYNPISTTTFFTAGGINTLGVISASLSNTVHKVPIDFNYDYYTTYDGISSFVGAFYTTSDTIISGVTITNGKINTPPSNARYMLLTITPNTILTMRKKAQIVSIENVYGHCINKPYSFSGKSSLWIGDSIIKGYTSGETTTTETLPKLFSNKVGMTYVNNAVPGALLTPGYNAVATILQQLQGSTLTGVDVIFIGAGTNDYGLGASLTSFRTALSDLCTYLKANFIGEVIFITPINRVRASDNYVASLNTYRNLITEYAMINDYSVIAGNLFNFPSEDGSYAMSAFGDGTGVELHPTELGYRIYARELATVLC